MAWSAENATKAYLTALGNSGNNGATRCGGATSSVEPDVAEFISAMAAGSSAQLMVDVCASVAGPTTLALAAAAEQTGGRVVCIVPTDADLHASASALAEAGCGDCSSSVELVASSDPAAYLLRNLPGADFVLLDCRLEGSGKVFAAARAGAARARGGVVVGYKALRMGRECGSSWRAAQLLPIGDGLRVSRVKPEKKSRWVVRVDECTGEEHVFRVVDRAAARSRWVEA